MPNDFESNVPYVAVPIFERVSADTVAFVGMGTLIKFRVGASKYSTALLTHDLILDPRKKYRLPFYTVTSDRRATSNTSFATLELSDFEGLMRRDGRSPLVAVLLTGFFRQHADLFVRELDAETIRHSRIIDPGSRHFTISHSGNFETVAESLAGRQIVDVDPTTGLDDSISRAGLLDGAPLFSLDDRDFVLSGILRAAANDQPKHLKHVMINAARIESFIDQLQSELHRGAQELTFGVQDQSGLCSHSWTLNVDGRNIYLAQTATRKALHISLHESGRYHTRFDREFLDGNAPPDSKLHDTPRVLQWEPCVVSTGLAHALLIYIPHSSVSVVADPSMDVQRVPQSPPGQAVEFSVLLQKRRYVTDDCPRKDDSKAVGYLDMPNGDRVWVSYRYMTLPEGLGAQIGESTRFFEGDIPNDEQLGYLLFGRTAAGVAFIVNGRSSLDEFGLSR